MSPAILLRIGVEGRVSSFFRRGIRSILMQKYTPTPEDYRILGMEITVQLLQITKRIEDNRRSQALEGLPLMQCRSCRSPQECTDGWEEIWRQWSHTRLGENKFLRSDDVVKGLQDTRSEMALGTMCGGCFEECLDNYTDAFDSDHVIMTEEISLFHAKFFWEEEFE